MKKQRVDLFSELKKRIIQCRYKPGSALEENDLCAEFGVSRTPYREALIKLEAQGLVEINPKKGVVVSGIDIMSLKDMFEARAIIEKASAQLAFRRIQPHHLKALKDIVDKIESLSLEDYAGHMKLDAQFHDIIFHAQGNKNIAKFQSELRERHIRLWNYVDDQGKIKELRISSIREIKKVYKGFETRDLNAVEKGMQEHFSTYLSLLVSQLVSGIECEFDYSQNNNSNS